MANSITAAASKFRKTIFKLGRRSEVTDSARQGNAFGYWDDTPEVRFSGIWVGRAMSKCRIFAAIRQPDGEIVPAPAEHPATELVQSIAGGPAGQSQLLEAFGPHLVVAGEGWVVVVPKPSKVADESEGEDWYVLSVREVDRSGDVMKATVVVDGAEVQINVPAASDNSDPNAPLAIRVWNPHPARYIRADSPVMSSTVILDELRLLNAAVAAIAKSRLVGRGVFLIPEGTKLPDGGGDLMETFLDIAELAYSNPSAAAAGVPILMEVPKGVGMEPKHIKFESQFDELALKLRDEAIRRYATASDTPAEVLLGQASINHWGVWAIRDEAVEIGVEPRLATVCDGLTSQWLWPALEAKNVDNAHDYLVWYDTSTLRVRTNKSQTAIELGKDGVISPKAVRRETGFTEEDAPAQSALDDPAVTLALKLVENAPTILKDMGLVEIVRQIREVTSGDTGSGKPTDEQTTPDQELPIDEVPGPPTDGVPDPQPAMSTNGYGAATCETLSAAIDGLIVRALERAGHKLRASRPRSDWARLKELSSTGYHVELKPTLTEIDGLRLLDGAWDRVPEMSTRYEVREDCLTSLLDEYVRDLLVAGMPHSYDAVAILVQEATCLQPEPA